jgi:hypothetical protein
MPNAPCRNDLPSSDADAADARRELDPYDPRLVWEIDGKEWVYPDGQEPPQESLDLMAAPVIRERRRILRWVFWRSKK